MAIVIKDGERLSLKNWEYNSARIVSELAKIVVSNNGKVKPTHYAIVTNRTLSNAITEMQERIEGINNAIEKYGSNETRQNALSSYKNDLEKYQAINNDPLTVTHTTYITFVLNDYHYYYQTDDNPFFDFYYHKTPIIKGQYSADACMEADKKEWLYDCFFEFDCSQENIIDAANFIYNMLVNSTPSVIRPDSTKIRVPNTYNDGYHCETKYSPRFTKMDF